MVVTLTDIIMRKKGVTKESIAETRKKEGLPPSPEWKKAFTQKEIQHFTKPKWHKKGVYQGEEKIREQKKLLEDAEKEREEKWLVGPFVRKKKKSGKISTVKRHERRHQAVQGSIPRVKEKIWKRQS